MDSKSKNKKKLQDNLIFELTLFYFKKISISYGFYLGIILIPFLFSLFFLTQLPSFLTIDSVISSPLIFNTFFFYGIIFFNFRRSHFYILLNQKFNNKKIMIYLPIFLNLIIIAFITFLFSLLFIFIFEKLDGLLIGDGNYAKDYFYQIRKIVDYRGGLLIYYLALTFLITFVLAFLLQTLSKKFSSYFLLVILIFILVTLFSGTLKVLSTFNTPSSDSSLYSYNQNTQVLTFKPYFDRDDPGKYNQKFFYDFSFRKFLEMINPYYYLTTGGQFDIFIEHYRTTTLNLGENQIIIDEADPSTGVQYHYIMFSFVSLFGSFLILSPYIFILFYGFLGIFITNVKKKHSR